MRAGQILGHSGPWSARGDEGVWAYYSTPALAAIGQPEQAYRHVGMGRELWTPTRTDPFGDLDRPVALLEIKQGRFDRAEQFAAASVRRWEGFSQRAPIMSEIVLGTAYVKAGEPQGLQLAHNAVTAVAKLTSVRVRRKLAPLVEALEARPRIDARDIAQMARQLRA